MNTTFYFNKLLVFVVYFLFFSEVVNAQKETDVAAITQQLIKNFETYHLQPRSIDDAFGKSVHGLVIEALDPNKLLFTKEQVTELEALSIKIDDDISAGQTSYLLRLKELLKESIVNGEKTVNAYFTKRTNVLAIQEISVGERIDFVTSTNHKKLWDFTLRDYVLNQVVDNLSEQHYEYSKDSLNFLLADAEKYVQSSYSDLFKNLGNEWLIDEVYLNAIAETFDPHSSYFSPEKMKRFEAELTSEREIFGINYYKNLNGEFELTHIFPGSSAWLSGEIHEEDIIISLKFGENSIQRLEGKTLLEVNQLFAENKETLLTITVRNAEGKEVTTDIEKRKVYSDEDIVKTAILTGEKKIGYISLPDFYSNETDTTNLGCANDIAKAIIKMKLENIDGLILDLRYNGGGSLREALDLAGIFIDYGPILVNRDEEANVYSLKDLNKGSIYKGPLVVMINHYSASASEVVAASLQDYNRAIIVGQPSFGKATGQFILPFDMEQQNEKMGFVKITHLGLYRVDLSTNQRRGVLPDIHLIDDNSDDVESESDYDNALELDTISKKIYFTPLPEQNFEALRLESEKRQSNSTFISAEKELLSKLNSRVIEMDKGGKSLDERLVLNKEIDKITKEIETNTENFKAVYQVAFIQKDNDLYSLSPFLNEYRERFKENLEVDFELNETYSILLDYLK